MSSGFNGIPIRGVGRTRERLADMLNEALKLNGTPYAIAATDLKRTNPYHRCYEDTCAWDVYTREPLKRHVYSWATMTALVKLGKLQPDFSEPFDIEV
jgi:hypothetical protein